MSIEVLNNVIQELGSLTTGELKVLNHRIVEIFKHQDKMNAMAAAGTFLVGDKVCWTGKRGYMEGVVTKIKSKNIDVNAGDKGQWIVTASMLKKIEG